MNRDNPDFLLPMFPFAHFSDFNILIVNQTVPGKELASGYPNVRVLNVFERGLSRSRNLAMADQSAGGADLRLRARRERMLRTSIAVEKAIAL